ncbi:MAG: putative rane protein YeiB [Modestobacter sp.]|jgi:uncharacterized membrane protein|nr:putative rane protein YeiB [Modestobacter sp.]
MTRPAESSPEVASPVATPLLPHACEADPPGDASGTPATTAAARGSAARLVGIDAARGIALIGMMAVHNIEPEDADGNRTLAWVLSDGKSAALFALLAGVGVAFASGGRRRSHGRAWLANSSSLVVRAALIGTVGLLLGLVVPRDYAAVILPYYALLFVLAIPLLALSIRSLLTIATVVTVAMPFISHLLRSHLAPPDLINLTFADLAARPLHVLAELSLTGIYPALPWTAYLCVGLAVGRSLLTSRRTLLIITAAGLGLIAVAVTVSRVLLDVVGGRAELTTVALRSMTPSQFSDLLTLGPDGITPTDTWWWLATMSPHSTTPLDLTYTIGVGLAVLGACLLIGRTTTALLRPLATAGSMTLTLYSLHLLLLSSPFVPGGMSGFLIQTAAVVVFALLWSRNHARGPLEDIVARLTGAVRRAVLGAGRTGARDATA